MFRVISLSLLVLFTATSAADAGCLFRRNCNRVVAVKAVNHAVVAQKVVDVQFTPTFVSFVPSQVLLNSQVTTYGAPTSFSYSYQGGYQTAQPNAYAQPQNGYAQPQPQAQPQAQAKPAGSATDQRLDRLEKMLLKILGEEGAEFTASSHISGSHAVFNGSCKKCHAPGGKGYGALKMYDESGTLLEKLPRYKIYSSMVEGRMPPSVPITDKAKLEDVRKWLHDGLSELEY